MSIVSGMPSSDQNLAAHGPGAMTTCSPTSIGPALVSTADTEPSSRDTKPVTSTPSSDGDSLGEALVAQPEHGLDVEREAALVLVEADGHALRPPVGEERLHVRVDLGLARDQLRAVADPLLALVGRGEVGLLHGCTERDVADRVVVVRGRDPTPRPRRTPASARSSPAGSSCCGRRRTRFPTRPRPASPCRARRRPRPTRRRAFEAPSRGGRRSRARGCRRRRRRRAPLRNGHYCLLTNRVACTRTAR